MNKLITILFFTLGGQCYGSTFDLDTIDNWQIYNGTELLIAGHASLLGTNFQTTLRQKELKELQISYNHCVRYLDMNVTLEIIDADNNILITKEFKISSGDRMIIKNEELSVMRKLGSYRIMYRENSTNGINLFLGSIKIE